MQRKKVIALCQGVAVLVWTCGVFQNTLTAQTTQQTVQGTDTQKPSKPKKVKKSVTDATSQAAPAETGVVPPKAKKAKASTPEATPSGSADRAVPMEKPSVAPVKSASSAEIQAAKASGEVWVNTSSGVYHKNGKWYGTTKEGKFMSEQDAIKAGYRAAKNEK